MKDDLSAGISPGPLPDLISPRRRAWLALKHLAPDLWRIDPPGRNETPAPRPLPDDMFIKLIACLADTRKRAILRALLFDLLADDFADMIETSHKETNA